MTITPQQLYDTFCEYLRILPYGLAFFILLNYTLEVLKGIVDRILGASKKEDTQLNNVKIYGVGADACLLFEAKSNFVPQVHQILVYNKKVFIVKGLSFELLNGDIVLNLFVKEN